MPGWVWILIVVVVVLMVAGGVWLFLGLKKVERWRAEVLENGELATAWIVHVQPAEGLMWPIVLILFSPDEDIPDEEMRALVTKVKKARARKPKDRDGADVHRNTKRQVDMIGRYQLPEDFAGGREVYAFFKDLGPDDEENLPKGALEDESFRVKLMWDEHPTIIVVPPRKKRKRSD